MNVAKKEVAGVPPLYTVTEITEWSEFRDWLEGLDDASLTVNTDTERLRFESHRERLAWCDGFAKASEPVKSADDAFRWLGLFVQAKTEQDTAEREDAERRMGVLAKRLTDTHKATILEIAKGLERWMCSTAK